MTLGKEVSFSLDSRLFFLPFQSILINYLLYFAKDEVQGSGSMHYDVVLSIRAGVPDGTLFMRFFGRE